MPMRLMSEIPDTCGAYPRLTQPQLAALGKLGQRSAEPPGGTLFAEGDRNCDFFAILDGTVAVVDARGTAEERILSAHGRGRFLGFSAEFLQCFAVVSDDSSACGAARDLAQVVIADVREDPRFAAHRDRGHLRLPGHPVHR
jgi:CRP-like cAMP-binding protein